MAEKLGQQSWKRLGIYIHSHKKVAVSVCMLVFAVQGPLARKLPHPQWAGLPPQLM